MIITLDTRTFFFNADTDFLAYYKNNDIKIDNEKNIKDLLFHLDDTDADFSFSKQNTFLQINGVSIEGSVSIKEAVEIFGTSWKIEPVSTFRAIKNLIINDDDFIEKYSLLEEFGDDDDFKEYKKLFREYYASIMLKYNQDYFGDSIFIHAYYLIEKYPLKKNDILKVIDMPNGIWLYEKECNFYPKNDNDQKINSLKDMLKEDKLKGYTPEKMSYYDKAEEFLTTRFSVQKDEDCALETILDNIKLSTIKESVKNPFSDFSVAFYAGSFDCKHICDANKQAKNLLKTLGADIIEFTCFDKNDGFDIAPYNDVGYKKAGDIMLDANDSGAEILVVDSKESHFIMDQCVKKCETQTGRDIRIPILNISQMVALAVGVTDVSTLGLDQHKIKPQFI